MESSVNLFHLGMSVSEYGSIRVPRVGSIRDPEWEERGAFRPIDWVGRPQSAFVAKDLGSQKPN